MSHMKDAVIDAHNARNDVTDLSKLSSTEIIAKVVNLALSCDDGVWTSEANAKLHPLVLVLKQAVIRESSAGTIAMKSQEDGYPLVDHLVLTREEPLHDWHEYDLVPRETT